MTYNEKIIDAITGEETIRPFTVNEIAAVEAEQAKEKAEDDARAQKQATKDAARQAVLNKLGLSADEVEALLG
jgi:predicted Zn-ribbon and HTH transcriptional regulator